MDWAKDKFRSTEKLKQISNQVQELVQFSNESMKWNPLKPPVKICLWKIENIVSAQYRLQQSKSNSVFEELKEENSSNYDISYRMYRNDNSSSKPMICCSTDWKMKPETREHVLTIETIIYSEYQNEKSPCLDFIGGEAT